MDQQLQLKSAAKPDDMIDSPVLSATKQLKVGYHNISSWTTQQSTMIQKRHEGEMWSEDEGKIRGQIERDIERNLEEEIKDGIYLLALRLHRLYQHKRERTNRKELSSSSAECSSWLNISIGVMEGGTKVEIKEMKKEKGQPGTGARSSGNKIRFDGNKLDWTKSLRASSGAASGKSIGGSHCKGVEVAWKF